MNKTLKRTEILGHNVNWYFFGYEKRMDELDSASLEHIEESIRKECTSGELVIIDKKGKEKRGWWTIPNWQDIACEFRNALLLSLDKGLEIAKKSETPMCKEQVKQFDKQVENALSRFDANWA